MNPLDWLIVIFVALIAYRGLRAGFVVTALSLVGLVAGAYLGYRIAPLIIERFGLLAYAPLVVLGSVVFGALLVQAVAQVFGGRLQRIIRRLPLAGKLLGVLDGLGGALFGAVLGLGFAWVLGAFLLQAPLPAGAHAPLQRSEILRRLNDSVPSGVLLETFARLDPIPELLGPRPRIASPSAEVLNERGVRRAAPSVVRITGYSRGAGVAGSGWVAAPGLVVTNAHVAAGASRLRVHPEGSTWSRLRADTVLVDERNDLAILKVDGLDLPALELAEPVPGEPVAVLGYPENGPFDARPGRVGRTGPAVFTDARGRGATRRDVTSVRAVVRPGNSGGPVVNSRGQVVATIFAGRVGTGDLGYAIPASIIETALERAERRVAAGIPAGALPPGMLRGAGSALAFRD